MQAGERPMATAEGEEPQDTNAGEKKARVRGSGGTGVSLRPGEQQEAMRTSPGHLRGGGSLPGKLSTREEALPYRPQNPGEAGRGDMDPWLSSAHLDSSPPPPPKLPFFVIQEPG